MTTLILVIVAVVMLSGVGWWIGWQVAHESRRLIAPQVRICAAPQVHDQLLHALKRLGVARSRVMFVGVERADTFTHVTVSESEQGTDVRCVTHPLRPLSHALQHVRIAITDDDHGWSRVAALVLLHQNGYVDLATFTTDIERLGWSKLERQYLSAWRWFQSADERELHLAHQGLRHVIVQWPSDRSAEKAIALGNLADLCQRLPETPDRQIARSLEGLNAAREALQIEFDLPREARMSGLRNLLRTYQASLSLHAWSQSPITNEALRPQHLAKLAPDPAKIDVPMHAV